MPSDEQDIEIIVPFNEPSSHLEDDTLINTMNHTYGIDVSEILFGMNEAFRIIGLVVHGVIVACQTFLGDINAFLYTGLFNIVRYWLIKGPTWVPIFPGYGGMGDKDICARIMGTNSHHFSGGSAHDLCQETIDQVTTERTTIVLYILLSLIIYHGIPWLYHSIVYLWTYEHNMMREQEERDEQNRKREETNKRKKTTQYKNELAMGILHEMCGVLKTDNFESDDKVVTLRGILDDLLDVNEEYASLVLKKLGWRKKKKWVLKECMERTRSEFVSTIARQITHAASPDALPAQDCENDSDVSDCSVLSR